MHGWGPWYVLGALTLTAGCYLLGRRGLTVMIWASLGGIEVVSTVAVASSKDPAGWLVDQLVIILGGLFGALAGAYMRLRHGLVVQGWEQAAQARVAARLRERARIASRVHDTLGHDLTLVALAAGSIQVTATDAAAREKAAAVRAGAAAAISTLRSLVDELGNEDADDGPDQVGIVVAAFREAGAVVTVEGEVPADASGTGHRLVARTVQQALTNAVQHAPNEPIAVRLTTNADHIVITCANADPPTDLSARPGSGLAALAHELGRYGGVLRTERTHGQFRLTARLSFRPDGGGHGDADVTAEYHGRRRRARSALIAAIATPAIALMVMATAFYVWAGHHAILEPADYQRLYVGMGAQEAALILPTRQAPWHVAAPAGEHDCRFYTTGDFPLARGNLIVCFQDNKISSLIDHIGQLR